MVKVVWVGPMVHAPGGHYYLYLAYFEGEELIENSPRGWGQTQQEAVRTLQLAKPKII